MIVIKFAGVKSKNKNDHELSKREPLWYVVNDKGEMVVKPEVSMPKDTDFLPDFKFLGLTRLGYQEVEALVKPGQPVKKNLIKGLVDGRIVHKFDDIDFALLSSDPGLGRIPCEDPMYSVVLEIRGERVCWSKGIELMYFDK